MKLAPEPGLTYTACFSHRLPSFGARVAAKSQDCEWTYARLNAQANRLAHYLMNLGVGPEVLVAVCMERSIDSVLALLAIWKAGGAFLSLDPVYPAERLAYLLADSQARLLLLNSPSRPFFPNLKCPAVSIGELPDLDQFPAEDPSPRASADSLAYVLYTSGSTGKPKGVEITNRALLNHNLAISQVYGLCAKDRILQFASLSFDVALEEIFPAWLCGSTLVLRSPDAISSTEQFLKFIEGEKISVLNLPTAYWHELMSDLKDGTWPSSVRLVVIGGERASERAFERWKQAVPAQVSLINAYGPTEATITALTFHADPKRSSLPIGVPITNNYVAVLDKNLAIVPVGAVGELYLGGVGLARGYRHRPELTAERFIKNPVRDIIPSERLYRTGDLARVGPDGNLEFVGRVDDQIKIRGFRIEPGEIEVALRHCPLIKEAVVAAREDPAGRKRLVAYFVPQPKQSPTVNELVHYLRARLPPYMVPAVFISIDALPMTPAGKIDRQALPHLNPARPILGQEKIEAGTNAEQNVTAIWQEVLRINEIGVRDDFFALGGDSLLAFQILGRIRERFGIGLGIAQFFLEPTVAGVASAMERAQIPDPWPGHLSRHSSASSDYPPASSIQQQLFFIQEMNARNSAYHIGSVKRLRGNLNVTAFEEALNQVVARHETLRSRLDYSDGKLRQFITATLRVQVSMTSLAYVPRRRRLAELERRLRLEIQRPFDLRTAPLFRVSLLRFTESDHVLVIVLHHSIADGWSLGLLFQELEQAYGDWISSGSGLQSPPPRCQYRDFVHYEEQMSRGPDSEAHHEFWKNELAGAPRALSWPNAAPAPISGPDNQAKPAERMTLVFSKRTVEIATRILRARRLTSFMGLLGATALSLWKWTRQTDQVIGTVVAGRNRTEFDKVIGCFMNFLPLRVRLKPECTVTEFLDQVRHTVLAAQSHQDIPFSRIASSTEVPRYSTRNPLFNVALLWHNYPPGDFTPRGIRAESLPFPPRSPLLDLRFEAEPHGKEWIVAGEYDPALFDRVVIERLLKVFESAFQFLIQMPTALMQEFTGNKPAFGRRWLSCFGPVLPRGRLQRDLLERRGLPEV